MGAQLAQYQNQGMSRDVSGSVEQNNLVYENLNIRITTRGQETLLITTNEKGNAVISITDSSGSDSTNLSIIGVLLGYAVLGSHLILFTHEDSSDSEEVEEGPDRIYHIIHDNDDDTWSGYLMVEGDLNFDNEWPIETLVDYEGDTVQKVYWVDGRNQPRMLNFIEDTGDLQDKFDANSSYFDFVTKFTVDPLLAYSITKSYDSISNFHSGTVQYFFTYSNKYGQETNIVNLTDLQYLAYADRGADAESTVPCKFTIELSNVDTSFDYLNIYSVVTTSYNTTQAAYKVVELAINGSETLSYVDDGSYDTANATDADSLLYIGGRVIVPYTMTAKDQVLFLGNYILGTGNADDNEQYIEAIRTILRTDIYTETYLSANNITDDQNRPLVGINPNIKFVPEVTVSGDAEEVIDGTSHGITEIDYVGASGLYPYTCQLKETSGKITVFKGGELYRFGVQFMDSTGALSQVFWIGDRWNDIYPSINEDNATINRAVANYKLPLTDTTEVDGEEVSLATCLQALDYQVVTLMIAQASSSDRRVLAQGFLCPTMYNLGQRYNGTVWSIPSWYTRFRNSALAHSHGAGTGTNLSQYCEIQNADNEDASPYYGIDEDEDSEYDYVVFTLYVRAEQANGSDKRQGKVIVVYYKDGTEVNKSSYTTSKTRDGSDLRDDMKRKLQTKYGLSLSQFINTEAWENFASNIVGKNISKSLSNSFDDSRANMGSFTIYYSSLNPTSIKEYADKYKNYYFIDENILTFHSPEITEDTAASFDNISPKMRIVGIAEKNANTSDFTIDVDNPANSNVAKSYEPSGLNVSCGSDGDLTGLVAYPLWCDYGLTSYNDILQVYNGTDNDGHDVTYDDKAATTYFMIYPWHKEGSLQCLTDADTGDKISSLNSKIEANLHFSYATKYLWATGGDASSDYKSNGGWVAPSGIETLRSFWYDTNTAVSLNFSTETRIYNGNYDYVLSSSVGSGDYSDGYMVYNTGMNTPDGVSYNTIADASDYTGDENKIGGVEVATLMSGMEEYYDTDGLLLVCGDAMIDTSEAEEYLSTFFGCVDPIRIAFKSTPHAIIKLSEYADESDGSVADVILPSLTDVSDDQLNDACYIWDAMDYCELGSLPSVTYKFLSTESAYIFDISSGDSLSGDEWDEVIAEVFSKNTSPAYELSSDITLISSSSANYGILVGTSDSWQPYLISKLVWSSKQGEAQDVEFDLKVYIGNITITSETEDETTTYTLDSIVTVETDTTYVASLKIDVKIVTTSQDGEEVSVQIGSISIDDSTTLSADINDANFSVSTSEYTITEDTQIGLYVHDITLTDTYGGSTLTETASSNNLTISLVNNDTMTSASYAAMTITISEKVAEWSFYYTVTLASQPLTTSISDSGCLALFKIYEDSTTDSSTALLVYDSDISSYTLTFGYDLPLTATKQDTLNLPSGTDEEDLNPYVFIAELYMDKDRDEYYGGVSDSALENNTFIMAGKRTTIDFTNGTTLIGTEGDAFFQRWDCLKTYPYSTDYTNSIVDIFSFMVETHVNIDGRYDNRRGLTENRNNTTENFGLINKVYTQENNFVTGNIFDESTDETSYSNCVTWTTAKTPMADTDAWTNITTASSLPMDGRYGEIELLESNGSDIFCVQDKAVAKIRYNSNSAISTSDGVPIQLAMSGVVDGKVYATTAFGCQNKWSAHLLGGDLYFVDNINEEFVTLGTSDYYQQNKVEGLLSKNGFKDWLKNLKLGIQRWNPVDFANFRTYVDTKNMDVYYVLGGDADDGYKTALCYSSMLGKFESFYSYGGTPMMVNIDNKFISFHADDSDGDSENGLLWEQGAGEYNSIWGKDYPYWIIWRMSPNPLLDKIYGNIEYKADIFDMDRPEKDDDGNVNDSDEEWREGKGMLSQDTFDYMKVWNEYQWNEVSIDASTLLRGNWDKYPDIRQKFRSWRIDIPRDRKNKDNPYGLNRMRNPWLALKLAKTKEADLAKHGRMEFYNMILKYWSA